MDLIVSWWNWIYVDLFDRNTVFMVLFGWELFLLPIGFTIGLVGLVASMIASAFGGGREPS
jgi:hypothetical protein